MFLDKKKIVFTGPWAAELLQETLFVSWRVWSGRSRSGFIYPLAFSPMNSAVQRADTGVGKKDKKERNERVNPLASWPSEKETNLLADLSQTLGKLPVQCFLYQAEPRVLFPMRPWWLLFLHLHSLPCYSLWFDSISS